MLAFELSYWKDCPAGVLAGIDEAGRGPLAGPVAAAAVVMNLATAGAGFKGPWRGLTDSKKLSEKARETFFAELQANPEVSIGLGWASAAEIDEMNILRATHLAMARAVRALPALPDYAIVDGLPVRNLPCSSTAIVKGDAKSLLIAAASIIAKVSRDHLMLKLDEEYPGYGFAVHKGYGTAAHLEALKRLGPCREHRRSFAPVAAFDQLSLF